MEKKLKYRNIAISGKICTGATTLASGLSQKFGWPIFNAGMIVREYAAKNGIPLEETTKHEDKFHLKLDEYIKNRLKKEEHIIIESWLAGFDAQGIPGVLKVLLACDDALRIDRLVNRDNMTVEEAKEHIKKREEENLAKFQKLYGKHDFWDPKYYDLVIDTYSHSKEETLEEVLKKLGFYEQQK